MIKRSWYELSSTRTTVGVEDVAMQLPLATLVLPDHDVLALVEHLLTCAQECVPAHLDRGVTVLLDLGNLQSGSGDPAVHGRLPECSDGLPAVSGLTSRREQLGILSVETGEPSRIGLCERLHEPLVGRLDSDLSREHFR